MIRFSPKKNCGNFGAMETPAQTKQDMLNHLLSQGDAMVCLDARQPDVDVPKQHKHNPMLNLVLNLGFRRPIEADENGIYATLSFGGRPYKCIIPFTAVWAMYDPQTNEGQVWEESIPQDIDLMEEMTKAKKPDPTRKTTIQPQTRAAAKSAEKDKETDPKPKRDRSHLRVIK